MSFFYNLFKPQGNFSKALYIILVITVIVLLGLTIAYTTKVKEDFQQQSNNLFIFYAEWCGYCRTAMPSFQKLKKDYDNQTINGQKVSIQLIEGDKNRELMKQYNISGFPTIVLMLANGKRVNYSGNRSYDDLVVFLRENI